jgi:RHS repeat-associated protein
LSSVCGVSRQGSTSTSAGLEFSYDRGGMLTQQRLDGQPIANPTYTPGVTGGQLSSVSYPSGTGNAGNGTALASVGRDQHGRTTSLAWTQAGGGSLFSDSVTRSQDGSIQTNNLDGSVSTYKYDSVGRLRSATSGTPASYTARLAVIPLSALWRLGESSGTTASDASGAGQHATYTATVAYGQAGGPTGDTAANTSINPSATGAVGIPVATTIGTTKTFSLWFKTSSSGVLLSKNNGPFNGTSPYHNPILYVGLDGRLWAENWSGPSNQIRTSDTVNDGDWHHTVLVSDGSAQTQTLYLDGSRVGQIAGVTVDDSWGPTYAYIGTGFVGGWPSTTTNTWMTFNGQIDDVAVWNTALSAAQVANLDAPAPVSATSSPTYDSHGNTINDGVQVLTFDIANRHLGTYAPSQTLPRTSVVYTRDAGGSIVARTSTVVSTIGHRATATGSTGAGAATSVVVNKPAGVVSGDALIAGVTVAGGSGVTVTPPAGWTSIATATNSTTIRTVAFRKVAGGSEPASYTFTLSVSKKAAASISAYTGVDPATPVDVSATATNATSTSQVAASVTTTTGGYRQLVEIYGAAAATTFTPPGGQTERADVATSGTGSVTLEAADKALGASGATGTSTATSALTGVGAHVTVALRPLTTVLADRYSGAAVLDTSNVLRERTFTLPGGAAVTKRSAGDVWSYPNIHGDTTATANAAGVKQGANYTYDPYGGPIAGIPDTQNGNADDAWLGQHQKLYEHETNLTAFIEMGSRIYGPSIGRFLSVDPIEGGSCNDYDYVCQDPSNANDLNGTRCRWWNGSDTAVKSWTVAADPSLFGSPATLNITLRCGGRSNPERGSGLRHIRARNHIREASDKVTAKFPSNFVSEDNFLEMMGAAIMGGEQSIRTQNNTIQFKGFICLHGIDVTGAQAEYRIPFTVSASANTGNVITAFAGNLKRGC